VKISNVDLLHDGGTTIIIVAEDAKAGEYILPTPFVGEPRHLSWNNTQLKIGSPEEVEFLVKLKDWLNEHAADKLVESLHDLDRMKVKHPPESREKAFAYHRVLYVADYLGHRLPGSKPPR